MSSGSGDPTFQGIWTLASHARVTMPTEVRG